MRLTRIVEVPYERVVTHYVEVPHEVVVEERNQGFPWL